MDTNEVILVLDQNKMDSNVHAHDRSTYFSREAARAVLTDAAGRIALMHVIGGDYYKLPGGGIDEGEEVQDALSRELLEETGSTVDVTTYLGSVIEWRDSKKFKQVSHAFKVVLRNMISEPNLTQDEIDEGFELIWALGIEEAITLISTKINDKDVNLSFMSRRDVAILEAAR